MFLFFQRFLSGKSIYNVCLQVVIVLFKVLLQLLIKPLNRIFFFLFKTCGPHEVTVNLTSKI